MSGYNLKWEPVIDNGNYINHDSNLKKNLEKRFGELPIHLDDDSVDYLTGLADAGIKGAYELISAIDDHGIINVYID